MKVFDLKTYKTDTFINITPQVKEAVAKSGVAQGAAIVHCPHTTAGITITENADPDVCADMLRAFEAVVPNVRFDHAEGNSPAHFKSILTGCSQVIPIENGSLGLGIWQGVYFCEFDGPRNRKFTVTVLNAE